MITAESRTERKKQKQRIRKDMKEMLIKVNDVASALPDWHLNSVSKALNPDESYWNAEVISKAWELITGKKNAPKNNVA